MLDQFNILYREATSIQRIRPLVSEEYFAFREKKGNSVKVVGTTKHLEYLPHYEGFYQFFQDNKFIWMIPVDSPEGHNLGFVLRGVSNKSYRMFAEPDTPQLLFGWHMFKDFKKGDPIVICEGTKDAIAWHTYWYPYTLAALTSSLSEEGLEIVSHLTDRIVFAPDSDKVGREQAERMIKRAGDRGIKIRVVIPNIHDWGTVFNPTLSQYYKDQEGLSVNRVMRGMK